MTAPPNEPSRQGLDPARDKDLAVVAAVCHEANRALQIARADWPVSPPWDWASAEQQESTFEGIRAVLDGAGPEGLHESWSARKRAAGWVYGPDKSETDRTHPCLVPYDALPPTQRAKDHLFHAIVTALTKESL